MPNQNKMDRITYGIPTFTSRTLNKDEFDAEMQTMKAKYGEPDDTEQGNTTFHFGGFPVAKRTIDELTHVVSPGNLQRSERVHIDEVPDECMAKIFSWLNIHDIFAVRKTCKNWLCTVQTLKTSYNIVTLSWFKTIDLCTSLCKNKHMTLIDFKESMDVMRAGIQSFQRTRRLYMVQCVVDDFAKFFPHIPEVMHWQVERSQKSMFGQKIVVILRVGRDLIRFNARVTSPYTHDMPIRVENVQRWSLTLHFGVVRDFQWDLAYYDQPFIHESQQIPKTLGNLSVQVAIDIMMNIWWLVGDAEIRHGGTHIGLGYPIVVETQLSIMHLEPKDDASGFIIKHLELQKEKPTTSSTL